MVDSVVYGSSPTSILILVCTVASFGSGGAYRLISFDVYKSTVTWAALPNWHVAAAQRELRAAAQIGGRRDRGSI
eukprot:SAG31_NODE_616_length_13519_cov_2.372876_10_plen_75_part_00